MPTGCSGERWGELSRGHTCLHMFVCESAMISLNICQAQTTPLPQIERERKDPGQSFDCVLPQGKDDNHSTPGGLIVKKSISFLHTSF